MQKQTYICLLEDWQNPNTYADNWANKEFDFAEIPREQIEKVWFFYRSEVARLQKWQERSMIAKV